ncbi:MAG: YbhB/YbcL family Raf kinase inhibitor-like protein [candidate division WOR-3 bacterium]
MLLLLSCGTPGANKKAEHPAQAQPRPKMALFSPAFENGQPIPKKFTGDGANVSPELVWDSVPEGTKSFALICSDPDAPIRTFIHWVVFNIPDTMRRLPEGFPKEKEFPNGIRQGRNGFGDIGYGGPMPPPGKPHRYFFVLYALDTVIGMRPGSSGTAIKEATLGHTLAKAELMGTYGR